MTCAIAGRVPADLAARPSDAAAVGELERRGDASVDRYPDLRPPVPTTLRLDTGDLGGPDGPEVEEHLAPIAGDVGVVVCGPLSERVVAAPAP